jgi:NAD(P)-dependent dehydrogenase (short-subunit alcohol dehydrogenase family)
MDLGLKGKTALITGASKGIGRGVAESLAAEGCHIRLAARSGEMLEDAAAELRDRYGVTVGVHAVDITAEGVIDELAAAGIPDILVNNAGAIPAGDIFAMTEDRWRFAWELKVFGYINMTRRFAAAMKERGHGVICNVTGLAADKFDYNYVAGTTGNAGLNAFTKAIGGVSLEFGVRVFAVSPGPVQTERLIGLLKTRAVQDGGSEDNWQSYMSGMPMQRAATVPEVADTVVFLVSDRATYFSGQVVTVDGGQGSRGGSFTNK